MVKTTNRRRFLQLAGGAISAVVIGSPSVIRSQKTFHGSVNFPEIIFKNSSMSNKILVTYASCTGSTGGVAEVIRQILAENGTPVELRLMKNVEDISAYKAIVAGSAIHGAQWLPEAMQFMQTHQTLLSKKPFAAFLVCMTLAMPKSEKYYQGVTEWLNPVRELVKPLSEGFFAGALDIDKIPSLSDRLKFRTSVMFGVWKEGDHRDWNAIVSWTKNLKFILDK